MPPSVLHGFIIATTVTLEQVTSLNTSFLKSFCPNENIILYIWIETTHNSII
jgi:hypothetical protein